MLQLKGQSSQWELAGGWCRGKEGTEAQGRSNLEVAAGLGGQEAEPFQTSIPAPGGSRAPPQPLGVSTWGFSLEVPTFCSYHPNHTS